MASPISGADIRPGAVGKGLATTSSASPLRRAGDFAAELIRRRGGDVAQMRAGGVAASPIIARALAIDDLSVVATRRVALAIFSCFQ